MSKSLRKSSSRTGRNRKDQVHKREEPVSSPSPETSEKETATDAPKKTATTQDIASRGQLARNRSGEELVHEVSNRLLRLDSHRRLRLVAKRLFYLLIFAGVIAGFWYCFGADMPSDLIQDYWDQIKQKLIPAQRSLLE